MNHLSMEQLARLKTRLVDELRGLEADTSGREPPPAGEDPGDWQDAAAEHAGRTQASKLLRRAQDRMVVVQAALMRFDVGRYGICEDTDEEISFARLNLDPAVRLTVEAQEDIEHQDAQRRADAEEETAY